MAGNGQKIGSNKKMIEKYWVGDRVAKCLQEIGNREAKDRQQILAEGAIERLEIGFR